MANKQFCFNRLHIELTRKCNMQPTCLHCMRGNPQDRTIKKEYIDTLLNQTMAIGQIIFSGGEPTLCLDEMDYVYEKLVEKSIPLFALEITSNGLIYDNRFVEILKKYNKLITLSRSIAFPNDVYAAFMETNLQISFDKYHNHNDIAAANLKKYREALQRNAQVTINTNGNFTKKVGNAAINNIKAYKPFTQTVDDINRIQICIIDKDYNCNCKYYNNYELETPEQVVICCGVELKVDGNIIREEFGDESYEIMDNPNYQICNVNDDIYNSIIMYNENRLTCSQFQKRQAFIEPFRNDRYIDEIKTAMELYNEYQNSKTIDSIVLSNVAENTTYNGGK